MGSGRKVIVAIVLNGQRKPAAEKWLPCAPVIGVLRTVQVPGKLCEYARRSVLSLIYCDCKSHSDCKCSCNCQSQKREARRCLLRGRGEMGQASNPPSINNIACCSTKLIVRSFVLSQNFKQPVPGKSSSAKQCQGCFFIRPVLSFRKKGSHPENRVKPNWLDILPFTVNIVLMGAMCLCATIGILYKYCDFVFLLHALRSNPSLFSKLDADQIKDLLKIPFAVLHVFFAFTWTTIFAVKLSFLVFFKKLISRVTKIHTYYWFVVIITLLSWLFMVLEQLVLCSYPSKGVDRPYSTPSSISNMAELTWRNVRTLSPDRLGSRCHG